MLRFLVQMVIYLTRAPMTRSPPKLVARVVLMASSAVMPENRILAYLQRAVKYPVGGGRIDFVCPPARVEGRHGADVW